jgi:hypothetical protein
LERLLRPMARGLELVWPSKPRACACSLLDATAEDDPIACQTRLLVRSPDTDKWNLVAFGMGAGPPNRAGWWTGKRFVGGSG